MMTVDSAAQEQEAALPMPDALGVFRLYQMQWLEARFLEKECKFEKEEDVHVTNWMFVELKAA